MEIQGMVAFGGQEESCPAEFLAAILDIHQIIPFVKLSKQDPHSRRQKIDLDLCWQTFDLT